MPKSRSELARQIARSLGLRAFRGHWDLPSILDDCESTAFELDLSAPAHAKASSIGWFAVKRVRIGRQHKESVRSITTGRYDKRSKRPNFHRAEIELQDIAAVNAPPSETVPFFVDYEDWLSRWDKRNRRIVEALAVGGTTGEVAEEFKVTAGRVSQLRRAFEQDWAEFQHAN